MSDTAADFILRRNNEENTPIPKGRMIFVRHGSTSMNSDGDRIRGWKDIPLDKEGIEEANNVAKKIPPVDCIYSSSLQRASDTAETISKHQGGTKLVLTEDLKPWDLGIFTGSHSAQIQDKIRYYVEHPEVEVPKGESFDTFRKRFLTFIINLKRDYPVGRIAVVSHYRGDRLLGAWEAAGSKPDMSVDREVFLTKGKLEPGQMRSF